MTKMPGKLRTAFADFFSSNRYARLVWQKESIDGRKPNFDYGPPNAVMAMDTRDGVVRELVPPQPHTHWSTPTFTWDGSRVVFTDNMRKKILVVNWDGSGLRVLLDDHEGDGRCWQSPDGRHWTIATEWNRDLEQSVKIYRVNVDNPAEKVEILATTWPRPEWAGSSCWASMSQDGNFMAAGFPNYNDLGILDVKKGTLRKFALNGCWPTMARDTTYHVLYTTAGALSHQEVRIVDRNENEVLRKNLGPAALDGDDGRHESLRWTPDRDYVTIYVYKGSFSTKGIANPRVVRLSDLRYVAIDDDPTTAQGNMDVWFGG